MFNFFRMDSTKQRTLFFTILCLFVVPVPVFFVMKTAYPWHPIAAEQISVGYMYGRKTALLNENFSQTGEPGVMEVVNNLKFNNTGSSDLVINHQDMHSAEAEIMNSSTYSAPNKIVNIRENTTRKSFNSTADTTYLGNTSNNLMLLLFTTFKSSPDRIYPQSQVVFNWGQYRPWIQPVLYSPESDGFLVNLAVKNGWHVYSEQGSNKYGTPLLKSMFKHATKYYNCSFYGFANADILFDAGILDTIKFIDLNSNRLNTTMVVGRRWNFRFYKYNITELGDIWSSKRVKEIKRKSSLFTRDAEDYFITTQDYPWQKIKDVVIGRPGYDNYLVSTSIQLGVNTLDATNTINAVHLTLNGSIFAGSKNVDSRFNKRLIGKFNYNSGLTSSARFVTNYDKSSRSVTIRQRWDPLQKAKKKQETVSKNKQKQENNLL